MTIANNNRNCMAVIPMELLRRFAGRIRIASGGGRV